MTKRELAEAITARLTHWSPPQRAYEVARLMTTHTRGQLQARHERSQP